MRIVVIIALWIALAGVSSAWGSARDPATTIRFNHRAWLYHEDVVFERVGDPSLVWLADGRQLQVAFGRVDWRVIDAWEGGRRIQFAYGSETGPVIYDPASDILVPVIQGWGAEHPLDHQLKQVSALADSATAYMLAYHANTRLWQGELTRLKKIFMHVLPDEESLAAFERWREAGRLYRTAGAEFSNQLFSLASGTMAGISQAAELNGRIRQQVLDLNSRLQLVYDLGLWDDTQP